LVSDGVDGGKSAKAIDRETKLTAADFATILAGRSPSPDDLAAFRAFIEAFNVCGDSLISVTRIGHLFPMFSLDAVKAGITEVAAAWRA
jgi:hypothetical protein